ncbi:hypothetical protein CLOM_g7155 [Closterium sp. NIES-68]|nr:hypothetical protein CLOM_g7155 [Closterium sp. NIES-68]GJP78958.1 hypothetical protein CLOP_g9216 [Closterium sp. NIES-67]
MAVTSRIRFPALQRSIPALTVLSSRWTTSDFVHRDRFFSSSASPAADPPPGSTAGVNPAVESTAAAEETGSWRSHAEACSRSLRLHVAPAKKNLLGIFRECQTAEEAEASLQILARIRLENAAYRKQTANFNDEVSLDVVRACIRAGVPQKALVAISPTNPFGLTPLLGAAHLIMRHATMAKDKSLLLSAYSRMEKANIQPSATTADIVISTLIAQEESALASQLADSLQQDGVTLKKEVTRKLQEAVSSL